MKLRIKFTKYGPIKFVGHLDMLRYFQKAIRRSKIDIAYSTGFSPHQIMSFAQPLGVGVESDAEYMDIEVHSITSTEKMMDQLNETMADGVFISDIRLLPDDAANAMASVAAAKYYVSLKDGNTSPFVWSEHITSFMNKDTIDVMKKTKSGEKELDLKPFIFDFMCEDEDLILTVDASSSGNIKPGLIMDAFYKENGFELGKYDLAITRLETFGRNKKGELIPLSDFGEHF